MNKQKSKFSCKGVSKKTNSMNWDRYLAALRGSVDKAQNTGFRVSDKKIVTYTQNKLGLSAYYDKRIVRWYTHRTTLLKNVNVIKIIKLCEN